MIHLSFGSTSKLSNRFTISTNFIKFIYKLHINHGTDFTVKWLKACHVCLQRYLGNDRISSLRDIVPDLPLPRIINGLSAIIGSLDREKIRKSNSKIIRFWSSLFSVYRVIKVPSMVKYETITGPFTGSSDKLLDMISYIKNYPGAYFYRIPAVLNLKVILAPRVFNLSSKSSPSNAIAYTGIFKDISLHEENPHFKALIDNYLAVIERDGHNLSMWKRRYGMAVSIIKDIESEGLELRRKKTIMDYPFNLSQFALKIEPAGKIRVFALLDSVSQSVLKPLHNFCFDILRSLPNDGTFDQDVAVKRCSDKALKFGCALV